MGRYDEALATYQRAFELTNRAFGPEHGAVADILGGMAEVNRAVGRQGDAAPLSHRALAIREKTGLTNTPPVVFAGLPSDPVEAFAWLRQGAGGGDARAQIGLAVAYADGRGVARDDAEAVRWARKSADQEFPAAQYYLGAMYADGRGVAKDDVEALRLFRLAADQGFAAAESRLGYMYLRGLGAP